MELRPLGKTSIRVSPVALGLWPIAGMTSLDVNDADSLATIAAALDCGINFFDTAYCYGANGESERLFARAIGNRRDQVVIATKGGIHWDADRKMQHDARPETLRRELDESLERLNTDRVDLLYLHSPDPKIDIAESAGELKRLLESGKTRSIGVSNVSLDQLERFAAVCPVTAYQPAFNMLQREIEADRLPWCREQGVSVCNYWPLMKGLLTGKFSRDHQFDPRNGRQKYPMFQGDEFQKNQNFIDDLRAIAAETGHTTAQVVVNWTIHRPGITSALCGAKRPEQIRETAAAMHFRLTPDQLERIDQAILNRGPVASRGAV